MLRGGIEMFRDELWCPECGKSIKEGSYYLSWVVCRECGKKGRRYEFQ